MLIIGKNASGNAIVVPDASQNVKTGARENLFPDASQSYNKVNFMYQCSHEVFFNIKQTS